jgi:hypothetical protein
MISQRSISLSFGFPVSGSTTPHAGIAVNGMPLLIQ